MSYQNLTGRDWRGVPGRYPKVPKPSRHPPQSAGTATHCRSVPDVNSSVMKLTVLFLLSSHES